MCLQPEQTVWRPRSHISPGVAPDVTTMGVGAQILTMLMTEKSVCLDNKPRIEVQIDISARLRGAGGWPAERVQNIDGAPLHPAPPYPVTTGAYNRTS